MRTRYVFAFATFAALHLATAGEDMQRLVDALSGRWAITQENADGTTARGEEAWYAAPRGKRNAYTSNVTN